MFKNDLNKIKIKLIKQKNTETITFFKYSNKLKHVQANKLNKQ